MILKYKITLIFFAFLLLSAAKCSFPLLEHDGTKPPLSQKNGFSSDASEPRWAGIRNVGNSCYASTMIHLLYFTPGFKEALDKALKTAFPEPEQANVSTASALNDIFKAIGNNDIEASTKAMILLKERSKSDSPLRKSESHTPFQWLSLDLAPSSPALENLIPNFLGHKITQVHEKNTEQVRSKSSTRTFIHISRKDLEESGLSHTLLGKQTTKSQQTEDSGTETLTTYLHLNNNLAFVISNIEAGTKKVQIPLRFEVALKPVATDASKNEPTHLSTQKYILELYGMAILINDNHYYAVVKTSSQTWHSFDFGTVQKIQPTQPGEKGYFEFGASSSQLEPILLLYQVVEREEL